MGIGWSLDRAVALIGSRPALAHHVCTCTGECSPCLARFLLGLTAPWVVPLHMDTSDCRDDSSQDIPP